MEVGTEDDSRVCRRLSTGATLVAGLVPDLTGSERASYTAIRAEVAELADALA